MSKMDRQLNSKKDKETIYEIYRACRLCGAGAGYKMPIIQNVVDMGDTDVELRQKVRDCVQIEVHQDDKMPPLICELCVDKVNDFYEFLEMCRQTNKRTRLRLGLPPQSMPKGAPDAGECILGLTEPVYVNEDSDGEPLSKQKKLNPKVKVKREPELKVKLEKRILTETRPSRFIKRAPTPPRITRQRTSSKEDNMSLSRLKKDKPKSPTKVTPKSILKKETRNEANSLLTTRMKRSRVMEPVKLETPNKRVKIQTKTTPPTPKTTPSTPKTTPSTPKTTPSTPKPSPKSSPRVTIPPAKSPKIAPKRAPSPPRPPRVYKCAICGQVNKNSQGYMSHMKIHVVGFTSLRLACNPCGEWFTSAEEASTHHKHHKIKWNPYTCRECADDFINLSDYDEHFDKNQCKLFVEVPDVKCDVCWQLFATNNLLDEHKCLGEDHRPGGRCGKCKRSYTLLKNLKKHEDSCTAKKKGELVLDPVLLGQLRPLQIRVSPCEPLLSNLKQDHYDVSNVPADFGLDKNCEYPYFSPVSRIRIEEVTSSSVFDPKKVDTLSNLSLKCLFPKKSIGKVPMKKRRVTLSESLLAETEDDVTRDINNIINNLSDDDEFDGQSKMDGDESQKYDDKDKSMDVSDDKDANVDDGKETENVVDNDTDVDDKVVNKKNNDVSIAADDDEGDDKAQNDIKFSDVTDSTTEKKENNDSCDDVSKQDEEDNNSASKNLNSVCNDMEGSNNNLSSNNKDSNDDLSRKDKVNVGSLNNFSFDYDDGTVLSKNGSESKVNDITSSASRDANQNDDINATEAKNEEINFKFDFENNQDSNSVGAGSDSLLNDNTQSDIGEKNKETIDNVNTDSVTSLSEQNTDIDENKTQSNEFPVDSLSQESIPASEDTKTNDSCQRNEDVTENDYTNAISVIVNSGKSKISTESEEIEDSRLMEALDAQIGVGNENSRDQINDNSREQINDNSRGKMNDNFNDTVAIDDLISAKSNNMDS